MSLFWQPVCFLLLVPQPDGRLLRLTILRLRFAGKARQPGGQRPQRCSAAHSDVAQGSDGSRGIPVTQGSGTPKGVEGSGRRRGFLQARAT